MALGQHCYARHEGECFRKILEYELAMKSVIGMKPTIWNCCHIGQATGRQSGRAKQVY